MNARARKPRTCNLPGVLAVGLLVAACSSTVSVRSPLAHPPLVERAPKTVAIRYAEDLVHHNCLVHKGYIAETWSIALGQPSKEMFDYLFSALFEKTFSVAPHMEEQATLRSIPTVEVRLLEYTGCDTSWPIVGTTTISVAYQATLRDSGDVLIARWQGRGQARAADYATAKPDAVQGHGIEALHLSTLTKLAMRKALADFIINYENDADIRAWLGK